MMSPVLFPLAAGARICRGRMFEHPVRPPGPCAADPTVVTATPQTLRRENLHSNVSNVFVVSPMREKTKELICKRYQKSSIKKLITAANTAVINGT